MRLRFLDTTDSSAVEELTGMLIEAVGLGASIGFLENLEASAALDYWRTTIAAIGPGLAVLVAEIDGRIVGTVQLSCCLKANGPHRAEVQKLLVLSSHRGHGIGTSLMNEIETFALQLGRNLLVLDTQAGSQAESLYQHLGWQKVGSVPGYALSPDGTPHETTYYFKLLTPYEAPD